MPGPTTASTRRPRGFRANNFAPFETFDELRAAREAEDRRILHFAAGLDDRRIEGKIPPRLLA